MKWGEFFLAPPFAGMTQAGGTGMTQGTIVFLRHSREGGNSEIHPFKQKPLQGCRCGVNQRKFGMKF
jgi:hypothetical protein